MSENARVVGVVDGRPRWGIAAGGRARALSAKKRKAIAKTAADARWKR
jgi:hypothetical protein